MGVPVNCKHTPMCRFAAAMTNGVRIECANSKIFAILTWLAACALSPVEKYATTTAKARPIKMPKKWVSTPNVSAVQQGPITFQKTWRISNVV